MTVLVTYASKHGSTKEIAERIAGDLTREGKESRAVPVEEVADLGPYEATVIGSAIYYGAWAKPAAAFVRANAATLAARPVWLFSSGPLGETPPQDPKELPELEGAVHPRGHRVFAGSLDRAKLSLAERVVAKGVKAPMGDFRDWDEIDAWAREIAGSL